MHSKNYHVFWWKLTFISTSIQFKDNSFWNRHTFFNHPPPSTLTSNAPLQSFRNCFHGFSYFVYIRRWLFNFRSKAWEFWRRFIDEYVKITRKSTFFGVFSSTTKGILVRISLNLLPVCQKTESYLKYSKKRENNEKVQRKENIKRQRQKSSTIENQRKFIRIIRL